MPHGGRVGGRTDHRQLRIWTKQWLGAGEKNTKTGAPTQRLEQEVRLHSSKAGKVACAPNTYSFEPMKTPFRDLDIADDEPNGPGAGRQPTQLVTGPRRGDDSGAAQSQPTGRQKAVTRTEAR